MATDQKPVPVPGGGFVDVPQHRVVMCHRWTHGPGAAIWRAPTGDNAEFADVQTCGSVWMCAVCSAKITSQRRSMLNAAIAAWIGRGGEVYLLTRTFSHDKESKPLPQLVAAMSETLSRVKGTRRTIATFAAAGVVGTIRALEVTHGELNGWHPHTHELIFARPGQRERLLSHRNEWIRWLLKNKLAGMDEFFSRQERAAQLRHLRRHALTVQLGDKAAEYVAKFGMEPMTESGGRWGAASELVKGHQKNGERFSGRTPFELLRLYSVEGNARAGRLFRDYALVFQGKAQLYWGKLRPLLVELCDTTAKDIYFRDGQTVEQKAWAARARFLAKNPSDEDIAATRAPDCSEFVVRFTTEEWKVVLRTNSRHDVLMAARLGGEPEVRELLRQLAAAPPTHRGDFMPDWRKFDRTDRRAHPEWHQQ